MGTLATAALLALAFACGDDDAGATRDGGPLPIDAGPFDADPFDAGIRDDAAPAPDAPGEPDAGVSCALDAECDDGTWCNGAETCVEGLCATGVPPDCDDDDPCTADRCDEAARACLHPAGDADMDGHAAAGCGGDDCDDGDPLRHPGNPEVCDATRDEDCDAATIGDTDADSDGHVSTSCCNDGVCGRDCDDSRAGVHPDATETCNGTDDDCDAVVDEGVTRTFWADADGDGFGDPASTPLVDCMRPAGYAENDGDCDDTSAARNPSAPEVCDYVDNDCDGAPDDGVSGTYYRDADGDLYGDPSMMVTCPTAGYVGSGTDCYDMNRDAHPGQLAYFSTDRGDGSFDYDCDTVESPRDTMAGSCRGPCNSSLCPTYLIRGWMSLPAPACGASAPYYVSCLGVGCGGTLTFCRGGTMDQPQHCR